MSNKFGYIKEIELYAAYPKSVITDDDIDYLNSVEGNYIIFTNCKIETNKPLNGNKGVVIAAETYINITNLLINVTSLVIAYGHTDYYPYPESGEIIDILITHQKNYYTVNTFLYIDYSSLVNLKSLSIVESKINMNINLDHMLVTANFSNLKHLIFGIDINDHVINFIIRNKIEEVILLNISEKQRDILINSPYIKKLAILNDSTLNFNKIE